MKKPVQENLTKADVNKEIKVYMDSKTFNDKVSKIVKDRLKDEKELEDKVVEITKNVITQLYKTLWTKRATWMNNLSNKNN
jgi:tryptophanyl-tRNA synthetase